MTSPHPQPARPDDHDDAPPTGSRYQRLSSEAVCSATATLQRRIWASFPHRSLWEVCGDLLELVDEVVQGGGISRRRIRLARVLSRVAVLAVLLVFGSVLAAAGINIWTHPGSVGPLDWLSLIETVVNDLVFASVAIFFLIAVPQRMERARVLRIVHRLRSLAHVIDMHQLVKVPERLPDAPGRVRGAAASSPGEVLGIPDDDLDMTRAQMARYLDYCTQMLSLVGKAAALFGEDTTDGDVLDAVEGIEALTSDMARKVWQKIAILQERSL